MWEKLNDEPKLYRHSKHALWLAEIGGQLQLVALPSASVGDVLALLQSVGDLTHEPEKKAAAPRR
jgi:hypothetical protein